MKTFRDMIHKARFSLGFIALLTLVLFTLVPSQGHCQQIGNIVEIFGRERAESTDEGVVVHNFMQGYALRNALLPGMLTGFRDILAWQIASGLFETPNDGLGLKQNYNSRDGQPFSRWEAIEVDSGGYFAGGLGRAYVYTEFDSPVEQVALLEATGHTRVFVNGLPREGDHYDYNHTLIPFRLKKGQNQFVYTYGRFARVNSKIVIPRQEVMFSKRDLTLPSVLRDERKELYGAIRIINASEEILYNLQLHCQLETGETATHLSGSIIPLTTRKMIFKIPALKGNFEGDKIVATLVLKTGDGQEIDRVAIEINVRNGTRHHERTFVSNIDGSVQYYSVAPSTSDSPNQAFVLSLHGASVEATNQTRAYKQKDWAHIVAPTNRRPFGFNWEEWGRTDALEVMADARMIFNTDPSRNYLTGHSMGGHGAWVLGATFPDKWAAIAPAAGYPDIIGYRRAGVDSAMFENRHFEMIYRGALPGRVVDLKKNYLQSGVYVLHGDADAVVPVGQARLMREKLGTFHNNFAYYEYPNGSHWYGDHSMDWPPLFDFLRKNSIPETADVKNIEFRTASPAVSASNYWITINQQLFLYKHSDARVSLRNDTIFANLENIQTITFHTSKLKPSMPSVIAIEGHLIMPESRGDVIVRYDANTWREISVLPYNQKNPDRYGGFKLAFANNVVFVYATNGTAEENDWYQNKARFDAETFLYRGNGSIEIIPDNKFKVEAYANRNVVIYGNANNNLAWKTLLANCPVQVTRNGIKFGSQIIEGNDLGTYFIYPRPDSKTASVGVVAGTGTAGMKSLYPNDYFSGITGFPDLLIFTLDWIKEGLDGVKVSGFFGNDWSVENGDFVVE